MPQRMAARKAELCHKAGDDTKKVVGIVKVQVYLSCEWASAISRAAWNFWNMGYDSRIAARWGKREGAGAAFHERPGESAPTL
jgi:hypothetical protein